MSLLRETEHIGGDKSMALFSRRRARTIMMMTLCIAVANYFKVAVRNVQRCIMQVRSHCNDHKEFF